MKGKKSPSSSPWITQVCILSVTLNVLLLLIFFYFFVKEKPLAASFEYKPSLSNNSYTEVSFNSQILKKFYSLNFYQLCDKLKEKRLVEDGYTERDLALACLVHNHHFDLIRGLTGRVVQQREITFIDGAQKRALTIYPGLVDRDYSQLIEFTTQERWPLTTKGLFIKMKQEGVMADSALTQAFCQSSEYLALESLFARTKLPIRKKHLLTMISEGSWEIIHQFAQSQRQTQDLSPARRECLLMDYIAEKSKTAAYLLILTDRIYAEKRLEDGQVVQILQLLTEKTAETQLFAQELLRSPRGDSVSQAAAACLYRYAGEVMPQPFNRQLALNRFCPKPLDETPIAKQLAEQKLSHQQLIESLPSLGDRPPTTLTLNSKELPKEKFSSEKQIEKPLAKKDDPSKAPNVINRIKDRPQPTPRLHIVQNGESLWTIAKKYQVDVDYLMKYNQLSSTTIYPGRSLKIPPK